MTSITVRIDRCEKFEPWNHPFEVRTEGSTFRVPERAVQDDHQTQPMRYVVRRGNVGWNDLEYLELVGCGVENCPRFDGYGLVRTESGAVYFGAARACFSPCPYGSRLPVCLQCQLSHTHGPLSRPLAVFTLRL